MALFSSLNKSSKHQDSNSPSITCRDSNTVNRSNSQIQTLAENISNSPQNSSSYDEALKILETIKLVRPPQEDLNISRPFIIMDHLSGMNMVYDSRFKEINRNYVPSVNARLSDIERDLKIQKSFANNTYQSMVDVEKATRVWMKSQNGNTLNNLMDQANLFLTNADTSIRHAFSVRNRILDLDKELSTKVEGQIASESVIDNIANAIQSLESVEIPYMVPFQNMWGREGLIDSKVEDRVGLNLSKSTETILIELEVLLKSNHAVSEAISNYP